MWTQEQAIALCCKIERFAPLYGCHVALTGGTLYKEGMRKDVDIVFYRIRQTPKINIDGLMFDLERVGVTLLHDYGFVYKAVFAGNDVDFFFPDRDRSDFPANLSDEYV